MTPDQHMDRAAARRARRAEKWAEATRRTADGRAFAKERVAFGAAIDEFIEGTVAAHREAMGWFLLPKLPRGRKARNRMADAMRGDAEVARLLGRRG